MNLRMTQADAVYQLTFFKNDSLTVNCFFVEEDTGLTLIDTAVRECASQIIAAAAEIGKPIKNIVLTHAHHDHIGSLDAIHRMLPEIVVHISAREARLVSGDRTLDSDEPDTPIRGNIPKDISAPIGVLLREGDRIGSLLSLETPGHTPGSMSFLDTRNNTLFAGDAFQTVAGIAVAGQLQPSFPFTALGTWNKQLSLESARKLQHYRPSLLAVGHGDMLKDPYTDMARAVVEAVS